MSSANNIIQLAYFQCSLSIWGMLIAVNFRFFIGFYRYLKFFKSLERDILECSIFILFNISISKVNSITIINHKEKYIKYYNITLCS